MFILSIFNVKMLIILLHVIIIYNKSNGLSYFNLSLIKIIHRGYQKFKTNFMGLGQKKLLYWAATYGNGPWLGHSAASQFQLELHITEGARQNSHL